jgi:hypothetical protein
MVTLKCIKTIKDSSVNRLRQLNEVFTVTPERALEMDNSLKGNFKNYFVVQKVAKVEKELKQTTYKISKEFTKLEMKFEEKLKAKEAGFKKFTVEYGTVDDDFIKNVLTVRLTEK